MAGCSGGHFEFAAAGMAMGCSPAAMTIVPRSFVSGEENSFEDLLTLMSINMHFY